MSWGDIMQVLAALFVLLIPASTLASSPHLTANISHLNAAFRIESIVFNRFNPITGEPDERQQAGSTTYANSPAVGLGLAWQWSEDLNLGGEWSASRFYGSTNIRYQLNRLMAHAAYQLGQLGNYPVFAEVGLGISSLDTTLDPRSLIANTIQVSYDIDTWRDLSWKLGLGTRLLQWDDAVVNLSYRHVQSLRKPDLDVTFSGTTKDPFSDQILDFRQTYRWQNVSLTTQELLLEVVLDWP